MTGEFLCGCAPEEKRGYSGNIVKTGLNQEAYTDKRFDSQGFEICPEHGERMYGWKSDDKTQPHYITNANGNPPTFISPNKTLTKISFTKQDDKRDNRDPVTVGR
jgi:hypothetical protein